MQADSTPDRALLVHERLLAHYGRRPLKPQQAPLDELIQTILSQNTSDLNSGRAFASLREAFPSWEAVAEADVEAVAHAIRSGGLARIKAPRIQQIIRHLIQERGEPSLDWLHGLAVEEARAYLTSLPGVGPKTAACVLLFSLHMPAMPVDTHVHRVAQRLGLLGPRINAERAHTLLEGLLPQDLYYSFHLLMIEHGRTLCHAQRPRCSGCPLLDICPHGLAATREQ
ncbi:MAG: endonuclease III domain-containing protein [Anaerolineae bacterium]